MVRILLVSWFLMVGLASAQDDGPPNFVAIGVATLPEHSGADSYRFLPFAAGRVRTGDVIWQVEGPGLSASLMNDGPLEAGAYIRYRGGRDDETGDVVIDLLPETGNAVVAGGFVRYRVGTEILNTYDRLYVGGRVGLDATGEYSGAFGSVSMAYATPLSRSTLLIANFALSATPEEWADAQFSVDAAGAAASGLAQHSASGGLQDISATFLLDQQVTDNWSLTGILGISRLVGDAADSPVVSIRGDEMQYFAGLGIGRRF